MDFTNVKNFLDHMAAERTPGNAICIYIDGKKVFEYAAGVTDLEKRTPTTGDEYYNIYSCSKITTVTAGCQLLEKGLFLLSDPLYEYIPEYRHMAVKTPDGLVEAKNLITVGDLFTMSAGFHYNKECEGFKKAAEITNGKLNTDAVARCMAIEPLLYEPGTRWRYSLAHDVLGGFISIITGKTFRDYVKENIFDPLGMTDTFYHRDEKVLEQLAPQYRFVSDEDKFGDNIVDAQRHGNARTGHFEPTSRLCSYDMTSEYDSGGGGLVSKMNDYAKLACALSRGGLGANGERILSPFTVELMKTNQLSETQLNDFNWPQLRGYGYGLGVRTHINPVKSGSIANIGEFGWGGAAGASVYMDSELKMAAVYVQHTLNPREGYYQPRLRNAIYSSL